MLASVSNSHSISHAGVSPHRFAAVNENPENESKDKSSVEKESTASKKEAVEKLSKEDQLTIQKLKQRDLEVKAHEQAHLSAAGNLASGGASFTFTQGPNGIRYATGGEVNISTSRVDGDPAATLRKADAIRRAALAPMSPSSQDQSVAARATAMATQAQADLSEQIQEKQKLSKETESETETETETEQNTDSSIKTTSESRSESNLMKGNIIDITS